MTAEIAESIPTEMTESKSKMSVRNAARKWVKNVAKPTKPRFMEQMFY
jgi:hypothetical protein